jgi:hypothetical protein
VSTPVCAFEQAAERTRVAQIMGGVAPSSSRHANPLPDDYRCAFLLVFACVLCVYVCVFLCVCVLCVLVS